MDYTPKRVYCHDFETFQCCGSCHSEWDDGYSEPMEHEHDNGLMTIGCCKFSDWYGSVTNVYGNAPAETPPTHPDPKGEER